MTKENIGRIFYVLYFSLLIGTIYLNFTGKDIILNNLCLMLIILLFITIFLTMADWLGNIHNIRIEDLIEKDFKTIKQQTINIIKFYLNI